MAEGSQPVDSAATVRLTSYDANALVYEVNSSKGGVVVFSEIYYPGWQATVDGETGGNRLCRLYPTCHQGGSRKAYGGFQV